MQNLYLLIVSLVLSFQMDGQTAIKYLELKDNFKPNEIVYLFGDNVKLREKPGTEGAVLEKLKIASELKIIKRTPVTYIYNGIEWFWYAVEYKNRTGYVIGGLISLDKKEIEDTIYLVSCKEEKTNSFIITRAINKGGKYMENTSVFRTESLFSLEVFDNKGLTNIKNMGYIDYHIEACGANGGGYYIFNDGDSLIKAIDVYQSGDEGIWATEELVFPNDEGGKEGKILYSSTKGEVVNESNNQTKSTVETCEFVWEGKLLELKEAEN